MGQKSCPGGGEIAQGVEKFCARVARADQNDSSPWPILVLRPWVYIYITVSTVKLICDHMEIRASMGALEEFWGYYDGPTIRPTETNRPTEG